MPACWKALLMSLHFCCSGSEMVHHRTSIPPSAGDGGGGVGVGMGARTVRPGSCSPSPCVPSACIASPVPQPCPLTVGYWGTKRRHSLGGGRAHWQSCAWAMHSLHLPSAAQSRALCIGQGGFP